MRGTPDDRPVATVHLDLDGAQDIFEGHGWGWPHAEDPLFDSGLRRFLEFFEARKLCATLFVIARSLDDPRKRALIEAAAARGHEIASHSMTHRYLPALDEDGKRREVADSRLRLEQALGVSVRGFRAPGYRIDGASMRLLAEAGYAWDSSVFPTARYAAALGTTVEALRTPHHPVPGVPLVEWPMPDHAPFPVPFNPSYALLLGDWLFRAGVRRMERTGRPLTLLFHLIDLADPLPTRFLRGARSRVFTLSTLGAAAKWRRCHAMLDLVEQRYRLVATEVALAEWHASQVQTGGDAG